MSSHDNEAPLGEQFLQNPYDYLQTFIRNMNNQIFLSEYQLNHLYSLLLLRAESPWEELKPNCENMKTSIEQMVNIKVAEVKKLLQSLSQVYEDKVKKNTFNQIERLMNIIRSTNKSIYIEKDMKTTYEAQRKQSEELRKRLQAEDLKKIQSEKEEKPIQFKAKQKNCNEQCEQQSAEEQQIHKEEQEVQERSQNRCCSCQHRQSTDRPEQEKAISLEIESSGSDEKEVMTLFYGIANLPSMSTLALSNCMEYSASERFIKFRMSKNYFMTIKNDDEQSFDHTSSLRHVSGDLFTHHIFPYLTAVQLFKARSVCREWLENVKQSWHSTFKREMFIQLMACEFCKQIEHYYKLIQLRNPFFQKITLLMHALIEIIQWGHVNETIEDGTIMPQLKKVLIVMLKLLGEKIDVANPNAITEEVWSSHKTKALELKQRLAAFFGDTSAAVLSINDLKLIKEKFLDDPFMRIEDISSDDKTPLLLVILIKQLTLQQILKNQIYFSQEYLMNTKKRLDNVSSKMPQQKGFLEGVYKILLLRSMTPTQKLMEQEDKSETPNFHQLLQSIFQQSEVNKPDFVIKNRNGATNIYLDKATKLDIIVSTVKKMHSNGELEPEDHNRQSQVRSPLELQENSQQPEQSNQEQIKHQKKQLQAFRSYDINLQEEMPSSKNEDSESKSELQKQEQQQ